MFHKPEIKTESVPISTVEEFAAKWELEIKKRDLKFSDRISYKSNIKPLIIPAMGHKLLTDVDYPLQKGFVCQKAEGTCSRARFIKIKENERQKLILEAMCIYREDR